MDSDTAMVMAGNGSLDVKPQVGLHSTWTQDGDNQKKTKLKIHSKFGLCHKEFVSRVGHPLGHGTIKLGCQGGEGLAIVLGAEVLTADVMTQRTACVVEDQQDKDSTMQALTFLDVLEPEDEPKRREERCGCHTSHTVSMQSGN
jgi:hypothetical protein